MHKFSAQYLNTHCSAQIHCKTQTHLLYHSMLSLRLMGYSDMSFSMETHTVVLQDTIMHSIVLKYTTRTTQMHSIVQLDTVALKYILKNKLFYTDVLCRTQTYTVVYRRCVLPANKWNIFSSTLKNILFN